MNPVHYSKDNTGLLLVDPYNDFLSHGGKLWPLVEKIAREQELLAHMKQIVDKARATGIRIFYVPHHRSEPGDYQTWKFATPYQLRSAAAQVFAKDTWGGEWHPDFQPQDGDVMIKEHWAQSGFANTDLDQQLKQHGVQKVLIIGLLANTCIEGTGRFAMELGYHVTLVKDATAAFTHDMLRAAHEFNGPTYASEILTTAELLERIAS
jgi:nicotinamidase-related amidase